ncbi:hypothetical protein TWF694_005753 [Orbilia ellipsospora]|uniref:BTB domain-containing protein n=1 Tax=Orbilia ellipsospora TaxID=2528407 RepID=A0AAV9WRV9_9PEZI
MNKRQPLVLQCIELARRPDVREKLKEQLPDIEVVVPAIHHTYETFPLHSLILASESNFFRAVLAESRFARLFLDASFEAKYFSYIIEWMYDRTVPTYIVGFRTLEGIFKTANQLGVFPLAKKIVFGLKDMKFYPDDAGRTCEDCQMWSITDKSALKDKAEDYFSLLNTMFADKYLDMPRYEFLCRIIREFLQVVDTATFVDIMVEWGDKTDRCFKDAVMRALKEFSLTRTIKTEVEKPYVESWYAT